MQGSWAAVAGGALGELFGVFMQISAEDAEPLATAIADARRIALMGLGREGLQTRGLAMRLFHMGLDAHVVGDMTTPPVGPGDLLIVSAGPGSVPTIDTMMAVARKAGARVALVTARPDGAAAALADIVTLIPAQTMADDQDGEGSTLPMGSLFELSEMLFFELLVLDLRDRLGETALTMRARHTNLE